MEKIKGVLKAIGYGAYMLWEAFRYRIVGLEGPTIKSLRYALRSKENTQEVLLILEEIEAEEKAK